MQSAAPDATPEELTALADAFQELLAQERRESARELESLSAEQRALEARLAAVENSRPFRYARALSKAASEWRARAGQWLLHSPFHGAYLKLTRPAPFDRQYRLWLERERAREEREAPPAERIAAFHFRPVFSVLMPVYKPPRRWLEAAVASVQAQAYPHWELIICDDASGEPWIRDYVEQQARADPRIRFTGLSERGGISAAFNQAGRAAPGDYFTFLDQDDVLPPRALFYVAEALQEGPADIVYSDEDRLSPEGERVAPIFRPAWSPDLLTSCMYMGHLFVVSREAMERAGWFRPAYDGSQDYDLALRITDAPAAVRHVPRVLYHWRQHEGSTSARTSAKPYTHEAGWLALEDAVSRRGWEANVAGGPRRNTYRLARRASPQPLASIIVVSRNPKLLERCLAGIGRTTEYANREIVVVQHRTGDDAEMDAVLERSACKRVTHAGHFDFAEMNNRGAAEAAGEVLVFLNDDVTPLSSDWLSALAGQAFRPEVGVAGARLVYPSGAIQHAGIAIGIMDGCGHPLRGAFAGAYWHWADVTRNVSGVTAACMAVRAEVFSELGGFDRVFPVNYNDVDLCLRARRAGYEVVYEPAAVLRHDECRSRAPGTTHEERRRWRKRWDAELEAGDPFYSPNLTRVREDASLRLDE
ncbi:MAG: glycosyltransferase [Bryobacteraceae bacterium]|nr:glycosyltransferase [Bryobacteraceae bacterium]